MEDSLTREVIDKAEEIYGKGFSVFDQYRPEVLRELTQKYPDREDLINSMLDVIYEALSGRSSRSSTRVFGGFGEDLKSELEEKLNSLYQPAS